MTKTNMEKVSQEYAYENVPNHLYRPCWGVCTSLSGRRQDHQFIPSMATFLVRVMRGHFIYEPFSIFSADRLGEEGSGFRRDVGHDWTRSEGNKKRCKEKKRLKRNSHTCL